MHPESRATPALARRDGICGHKVRGTDGSCSPWPLCIACAGVVVSFRWVLLDPILSSHAPSLTSSLSTVEAETLPSGAVVLSAPSTVIWSPPTSHTASHRTSRSTLIPTVTKELPFDHVRSPLFHHQLSPHSIPPTPRSSSRLRIQFLRLFRGLRSHPSSSALPDSLSG